MSEFETMREDVLSIKKDLGNMIQNLPSYSTSERASRMQKIESRFGELHEALNEIENNEMMFGTSEKEEAKKFLAAMKKETMTLESDYEKAKKKGSERDQLFSGMKSDSSSHQQINSLLDQRDHIEKGNSLTNELASSVNAGKEAGIGILGELSRQSATMDSIETHLDDLDADVEVGGSIIERMLCRSKRRTVFMIIVIIILLIAIGVFLYFIFRPAQ